MSRRKQARPSRLIDDEDDQAPALDLKAPATATGAKDKTEKVKSADDGGVDEEEENASGDDEAGSEKRQEAVRRQRQDAENNNSVVGEEEPLPSVPGHVMLEALQNTKVAVAQIPAPRDDENPSGFQELSTLQSTLFTLQHQQMMQLSLIQQLQSHLTVAPKEEGGADSPSPPVPGVPMPAALPAQHSPKPLQIPTPMKTELPPPPLLPPPISSASASSSSPPTSQSLPPTQKPHQPLTIPKPPISMSIPPPQHPSMCSISSSLASSIITNNDPPPSLNEPNTLEMLQKRAQEVLDNASQGLLANNLADELAFRKNGKNSLSPLSGGRNEPFFKHRCRYCGKVFGSDSALQIHIRSHTGERPFKCNVCGSRFTTKGNLKVHFQRHSSKFPHIKMNPNPVPEHLDKFHPPLLAQMGSQGLSPGLPTHPGHPGHPGHPSHPHHQFPGSPSFPPGLPLFRPPLPHDLLHRPPPIMPPLRPHEANLLKPLLPMSIFAPREEQDMPADLSKPQHRSSPKRSRSPSPISLKQEPSDECKHGEEEHLGSNENHRSSSSPCGRISDVKTENEQLFEEESQRSENNENANFDERSMDEDDDQPVDAKLDLDVNEDSKLCVDRMDFSSHYDDCSVDSKYSDEEDPRERERVPSALSEQPENLSGKSPGARSETSQRLPPSLSYLNASSPHSSTSSHDVDPAKDPAIYNSLLPRPGSNDNSWESLIEVTKTSETHKLQQLVDNIEHKLTDPNQCVICHRVLSCKSALQMHYRTHTGERPFRCKICGRAFTTKGNLKTHMGVHRLKPPMRMLHQCPVCHKKFTNALVLQQHIRLHTGEPTDLTPEQIHAAEIKDYHSPSGFPPSGFLSHNFPLSYGANRPDSEKDDEFDYDDDEEMSNSSGSPLYGQSFENQVRAITTMASNLSAEDLTVTRSPPPLELNGRQSPASSQSHEPSPSPPPRLPSPPHQNRLASSPSPSESNSQGALDLTPRAIIGPSPGRSPGPPNLFSGLGLLSPGGPSPLMTSALSSLTSSVLTSTAFSPLGMAMGPAVRGNTTCNICFKTFACNSALEIHYRSHTKERPFKCTICDRGFSTKKDGKEAWCQHQWRIPQSLGAGELRLPANVHQAFPYLGYATDWHMRGNMKQHMLTHKIRDMPSHLFENKRSPSFGASAPTNDEAMNENTSGSSNLPEEPRLQPPPSPVKLETPPPPPPPPPPSKRSPSEGDLPVPKRQPAMPKHLCQVCNKNFSSSSALQIHMRTHTGDKPFRCTVCQKAFTTKGNLKVHMGTHMWSNGASRRGRRMSLDLPPIPMNPKDSDFLQRRPDLFYPYLPTPFLNGVHQKLNEMNAMNVGHHPANGLHPASKYAGLVGFGGFGAPDKGARSPSEPTHSPPLALSLNSRRGSPPSRVGDELPRGVWDMHFDRKSEHSDEHMDVASPGRLPPRGEGLAA